MTLINNLVSINVENLVKIYGKGDTAVKAVDNVSLHIAKNEIILIMGPSGAGKTTFIQLLAGLLTPNDGTISYGSYNITDQSVNKLTKFRLKYIGFIFQTPNLLPNLTALQNVEIVLNLKGIKGKKAKQKAKELLSELGIGHRLSKKPKTLSGGEQQRVAIARALANDPSIIIADEPTASLDSTNGQTVLKTLRKIAKERQKTIVIVTHDFRIKKYADRIFWLEDGKLGLRWSIGKEIDPVCFMVLDKLKDRQEFTFNDINYEFCSVTCKNKFTLNPDFFIKFDVKIEKENVSVERNVL